MRERGRGSASISSSPLIYRQTSPRICFWGRRLPMSKAPAKTPAEASELLEEIRHLMELRGENPFKVRAFEKASGAVAECDDLVELAQAGRLTDIPGIGKGISEVLTEF